jgi:hypothetical protein
MEDRFSKRAVLFTESDTNSEKERRRIHACHMRRRIHACHMRGTQTVKREKRVPHSLSLSPSLLSLSLTLSLPLSLSLPETPRH